MNPEYTSYFHASVPPWTDATYAHDLYVLPSHQPRGLWSFQGGRGGGRGGL